MGRSIGRHYDGWGNPIMDFFGMKDYFRSDPDSTKVLTMVPPHRYAVIPTVEIRFQKEDPCHVRVYYVYPAGDRMKEFFLTERQVNGFRKAFSGKKKGWKGEVQGSTIVLRRAGKLHFLPFSKFGVL